jgi:hypothetical protein
MSKIRWKVILTWMFLFSAMLALTSVIGKSMVGAPIFAWEGYVIPVTMGLIFGAVAGFYRGCHISQLPTT